MSTYQSAIQNLIADNQAQVARTKAINNDIAKMEVSRYEQNMKLAKLGAKSATKFIGDFHTMRMENLQSEAYNDFFENQYKDYLNSDEAGEAETILGEAHESSTIYHAELGQARADGVSGDLIEKASKKHPMYGATIAKLQLRQEANKFEGYIRTAMAKDTTMLALPGVIDPSTNEPRKFRINEANSLQEKMAAHRYLRGKYFYDKNIGAYGKAFLSLPAEKGGSGFFQIINAAENGKDGIFARYEIQADIYNSNRNIDLAKQAFFTKPDAETFQGLVSAYLISVDDNGARITPDKAWKNIDTIVDNGLKSGHIGYNNLVDFADAIVPGSKSQKYPNGQTYAQKWPMKFGYKEGKFGKYFATWQTELNSRYDRNEKTLKIQWETELPAALEAVSEMPTKKEAYDLMHTLREKFGSDEHFSEGFGKLEDAINKIGRDAPSVEEEVNDLIEHSKTGMISDENISEEALKNPRIRGILDSEKRRQKMGIGSGSYKNMLKQVQTILPGVTRGQLGQPSFEALNGDQLWIVNDLEGHFDQLVESGLSPTEAYIATKKHYELNGGGSNGANLTMEGAKNKGMDSNRYSLDGAKKTLMDRSQIEGDRYNRPTTKVTVPQVIKNINTHVKKEGGNAKSALSAISADPESIYKGLPIIPITEEPNKESADYNKILWNSRVVPDHIIEIAKHSGLSISDVLQARLTAWGHGDLDPRIKEWLGSDLIKFLPGGLERQVFGRGRIDPYVPLATIAQKSGSETSIIENVPCLEQFSYSEDSKACNLAAAIMLDSFGTTGIRDLLPEGALEFTERIEVVLRQNAGFFEEALSIPEIAWLYYGFTGDESAMPLLEGITTNSTKVID